MTTSWRSSFRKTVAVPWRPRRLKLCVYRLIEWRRQKTFLKSSVSSRLCPASTTQFDAHYGARPDQRIGAQSGSSRRGSGPVPRGGFLFSSRRVHLATRDTLSATCSDRLPLLTRADELI